MVAGDWVCVAGEGKWQVVAGSTFSTSLLHLEDGVSREQRVEVDGVMPEALRCLVALPTVALERLVRPDLVPVAVLCVVLDPVHILKRKAKMMNEAQGGLYSSPVTVHDQRTNTHFTFVYRRNFT